MAGRLRALPCPPLRRGRKYGAMPILQPDQIYQLLRNLTSPVVAITSERGGKRNGMIADSAVRASIVPAIPRVRSEEHTSELQSLTNLVCRLLLEKKKKTSK